MKRLCILLALFITVILPWDTLAQQPVELASKVAPLSDRSAFAGELREGIARHDAEGIRQS